MKIPVGDFFEHIVNFLKDNLQGLFDVISTAVKAVIVFLENIFLLEPHVLYPSVIVALLFGLLVAVAFCRRVRLPLAIAAGVVACLVVGGIESYRLSELRAMLTPEKSAAIQADLQAVVTALDKAAPETTDPATTALNKFGVQVERGSKLARQTRVAGISLRDVDADEYQEILVSLKTLRAEADEAGLDQSQTEDLDDAIDYYESFSLIKDVEPVVGMLKRVTAPEARVDVLNTRTYARIAEKLQIVQAVSTDVNVQQASEQALASFTRLDPERLAWMGKALILALLALFAFVIAGTGMFAMAVIGFLLVMSMSMWDLTMLTLAMVLAATGFALVIGVPLGILAARSKLAEKIIRPVLDFMQTLPAFVYLIPAVIFFNLGVVPGAFATLIFAMPPAVRFTTLGIRQVPEEVVEAAHAFGANDWQMLVKAQLPIAMPTILAGLNQTIMLALSMVVIVGMIGAGGLGEAVLSGITQMQIGYGFESGISIVILAIYLDRLTQALGSQKKH
ncbi:ABC transporter permease subunit [Ruficoccus sp. ZRK36]|nr:ABC transporter permease subunit [Ruficoccus sp. ZRK36]QYY36753.1 ABC transporter permease subunit [Ruficoccus sp. ZRK36]